MTLSAEEVDDQLPANWDRKGDEIVRTYEFDDYLAGVTFVRDIAEIADEKFHHPEIIIGFRSVEVRLTNHEAGGITQIDLDMAAQFDDEF